MSGQDIQRLQSTYDFYDHIVLGLLILAGVIGILIAVFSVLSSRKGGELIRAKDQQLRSELSDKDVEIGIARRESAEANKTAAQANEQATQLEVQAEELRRQNLEVQRKINPRFLTTAEKQTIFDAVRPFHGHEIKITRLGDGEAGPYGDSIMAVFQHAGWRVQQNSIGFYLPPTYGIVCRVSTHPDEATHALIMGFTKARIEVTVQHVPSAPSDSWIDMLVALKPIQ